MPGAQGGSRGQPGPAGSSGTRCQGPEAEAGGNRGQQAALGQNDRWQQTESSRGDQGGWSRGQQLQGIHTRPAAAHTKPCNVFGTVPRPPAPNSCALTPATAAAQAAWVRFSPLSNTSSSLPRDPSSVTHQVTPVTPGNPSQQGADNSSSRWQGAGPLGAGQQQQQQEEGVCGQQAAPGPPDSLVFLQGSRVTAYLPSGELLTAPLPAPCAAMWPLPEGLLLVVSGALQHQAESLQSPCLVRVGGPTRPRDGGCASCAPPVPCTHTLSMPAHMECPTCHAHGYVGHNESAQQWADNGGVAARMAGVVPSLAALRSVRPDHHTTCLSLPSQPDMCQSKQTHGPQLLPLHLPWLAPGVQGQSNTSVSLLRHPLQSPVLVLADSQPPLPPLSHAEPDAAAAAAADASRGGPWGLTPPPHTAAAAGAAGGGPDSMLWSFPPLEPASVAAGGGGGAGVGGLPRQRWSLSAGWPGEEVMWSSWELGLVVTYQQVSGGWVGWEGYVRGGGGAA
jgi:hypothetical protein